MRKEKEEQVRNLQDSIDGQLPSVDIKGKVSFKSSIAYPSFFLGKSSETQG